jgi:RND family efflux transporter MFP subunit
MRARTAGIGGGSALAAAVFAAAALAAEPPLATGTAELREVEIAYTVDAVAEAVRQSTVSAQITGRVTEVNFDVGDRVRAGATIVRIDPREVTDAFLTAQAGAAQVQAQYVNAKANYERSQRLFEQKFVSQAALDRARAEFEAAQAQLEAARAQASQAAVVKGHADVVAPYGGVVAQRHVELGEIATPGKPLMTGFDPKDLRVAASVPQERLADVRRGGGVRIEFSSLGKSVPGGAVTVLPAADPQTHTTRVRVAVPEYPEGAYPGMFARLHFTVGQARKLTVPAAAVIRRNELTAVYVVADDGRPRLRQVRLGEPAGEAGIEILAGLAAGERVALDPVRAAIAAGAAGK